MLMSFSSNGLLQKNNVLMSKEKFYCPQGYNKIHIIRNDAIIVLLFWYI